jgi:hypothetical protein
MIEVLAFFGGIALLVVLMVAAIVGLAVWYENTSTACPDGQVYVTTDTIRGCMPWEEINE